MASSEERLAEWEIHEKLDAIADGFADPMEHVLDQDPEDLGRDVEDPKAAVGLQHRR